MKEQLIIETHRLEDLPQAAAKMLAFGRDYPVWLMNGEMGAGKTTLTIALCKALEVVDDPTSPTYSLVNEYRTKADQAVYHFDFYRIDEEEEAEEMGAEEYFYSGDFCFIEWSSMIPNLIPDRHLLVEIEAVDESHRLIKLTKNG
ncbi:MULTISPECIES: tRNA (adenosine(37)-N6)-threonylcarbamoyltransferase complex ATPase subunit type 1 TsaE [Persicobacter]|uniref:tRNA threonylcarbamoyladenosine biosynthesis protein TsaE n=1 Tax=Persicobacter diffluens TaxID=981 RepID=A0AAN4VYV5_9BACT|nr:tRNA (adenosine(37)-N6)-threonylcarbamoyltransferase complex ATPase subunit type 1 TsaE [Persicobacter sp. CCB-QB2]GJM61591.1 tRNA (adenosine(37)-N6)-threonylcarbamoyltransferase complex ATPase subunit type 1 TsaE [Persicobacter diffluens]